MNRLPKNKRYRRAITWFVISLCIFFAVLLLINNRPVNYVNINHYVESEVEYANGETKHFDDNRFGIVNRGDVVTVRIHLPEKPLKVNPTLCFYVYHSVTEVWCNGALLDSYGEEINAKGDMVGNKRFIIPLPDEAMGGEITIIFRVTEDGAFNKINNYKIYSELDAYQFIIDGDPAGYLVSIPLFFLGLIALIVFICNGKYDKHHRKGMYLAAFAILVSIWIMGSKGIPVLFGIEGYFVSIMEFICAYTFSIPILLYAYVSERKGWLRTSIAVATVANILAFAVALILDITNIAHFNTLLLISNIFTFISGFLLLVFAVRMQKYGNQSDGIFFGGLLILVFTGMYELFRLNGRKYFPFFEESFFPSALALGITAFLIHMVISYLSESNSIEMNYLKAQLEAENLSITLAAIPTGICRVLPGKKTTIVAANNIFYRIIGYSEKDIQGNISNDLYANLTDSQRNFIKEKIDGVLKSDIKTGEFEVSTVDNYNVPITLLVKYSCSTGEDNAITANVIDITDRKRMEEEIRIREEDYRLAVEASDHLYFNFDAETKTCTHMFDSEKLFGIAEKVGNIPESLIELGLCAPESEGDYLDAFRKFFEGVPGGALCLHLQNIKTHVYRWYSGSFRTVFDSNGKPVHAIVAFKDITEQREKEIAYNIHKQQIESFSDEEINYYELNLTTGICNYSYGAQAKHIVEETSSQWDRMIEYSARNYVRAEDRTPFINFLNTKHLLEIHGHGITETIHEYRRLMPNGDMHWLRASVDITTDPRTHEVRAYCVMEDIDGEKGKELERQAEQQRSRFYEDAYEKLSSSVMYGVCKYNADDDLTIVFANDIFYQMHGYASQEAAVAAGFTNILFATPAYGKNLVRAAHREYAVEKAGQLFETEYPTVDASGNRLWILCRGIYSPEEGIFNASVLNITDRRKAEEQLRLSEERYRLALSQSGKVFYFLDVPNRTVHLSDELAELFEMPPIVENMPESLISRNLIEPQSVENYRNFYNEIYTNKPNGHAIIACHLDSAPEKTIWFEIAFTSVLDARGTAQSAIITFEDLQEEHASKIAGAWKQLNLISVPESKYVITEYNLTQNRLRSQIGGLFEKHPDFLTGYDEINDFILEHFVYEEDVDKFRRFLDRKRLIAMFEGGKADDSIEYRALQSGSTPRWTSTSVQMIREPYSDDVLAQLLIMDINSEKVGQIEMAQSLEELKKELESSRIKVMINQMQPHFLYNALSAIQTIVKSDPDYAYSLIYDFTVHLRSSIKALSSDAPIPFTDELKNIRAYLNIEQMRFGDSLKVNYEIDCDRFSVIPLSIQPLAENAARHGVYPKGDIGGTVTIRTYETVSAYVVEVEDDGVGFDSKEIIERGGDSVGLKSLIFRLKSLMDADVVIYSKPGVGTKVTVTIPKERG